MSDATKTSKDPEEEKKALTESNPAEENTGEKTQVDDALNVTNAATSETKVRHDTVK